jgi:hypothetical protein
MSSALRTQLVNTRAALAACGQDHVLRIMGTAGLQ